jgi:tetratricopeptide (TPR) repeat protein
MNEEHTELTVCRVPARLGWVRSLAAFGIFVLAVVQANALANSASIQGGGQSAQEASHPQAKSEQERKDFNAAYALTGAANAETAANNFAASYPESELRRYLYSNAMVLYQRENNSAKMLAMGEKVLDLDPDNPLALVLTATALVDGLGDRDRDREKKIGTIKRNATRAIQSAEANYSASSTDAAKIYKTTLQAMAYSALGIVKLKTGDDAGAEKDLTAATSLAKIHPDPYIWYHLALAQDHRKKYAAALSSVEQALQLASSDSDLQKLAEIEHERLAGLVKGSRNGDTAEPQ